MAKQQGKTIIKRGTPDEILRLFEQYVPMSNTSVSVWCIDPEKPKPEREFEIKVEFKSAPSPKRRTAWS